MHYLMLVTLTLAAGSTSADARNEAYCRLMDDDSFCGDGGRFGFPVCDWFVIGGRWSGTLQETLLGKSYVNALRKKFPETEGMVSTRWVEEHRDELDQLWRRHGGAGDGPITRSSYESYGADDDAMPVTGALYQHFLGEYTGESRVKDSLRCRFIDLDDEPVDETFIGRKWLVVVDYHS
jgi:hypothetical protein